MQKKIYIKMLFTNVVFMTVFQQVVILIIYDWVNSEFPILVDLM